MTDPLNYAAQRLREQAQSVCQAAKLLRERAREVRRMSQDTRVHTQALLQKSRAKRDLPLQPVVDTSPVSVNTVRLVENSGD